jgi:hypothetical protein
VLDTPRGTVPKLLPETKSARNELLTVFRPQGGTVTGDLHDAAKRAAEALPTVATPAPWPRRRGPLAYVNQAHPFREGNGRDSKVFMEHLAQETNRYAFDFASIDKDTWNRVSEDSRPQQHRPTIDPTPLLPVFLVATYDRPAEPPARSTPAPRPSPVQASYPQSATDATRTPYNAPSTDTGPVGYRGFSRGPQTPGMSR